MFVSSKSHQWRGGGGLGLQQNETIIIIAIVRTAGGRCASLISPSEPETLKQKALLGIQSTFCEV